MAHDLRSAWEQLSCIGAALQPFRRQAGSHRYSTGLENCTAGVGAGLPAMGCTAAPQSPWLNWPGPTR
ncbi:hypothetical protein EJA05_20680 [Pseudomonas oryziphila]|uniref:Uncharacterized protein n=1 Tax=Pseudomonas entomophila TaxID=312306 RepID=A0A3S8UP11_9PSED|nr:hypothetical protein EJA05_20680 [Pseudomonas oryziphila]